MYNERLNSKQDPESIIREMYQSVGVKHTTDLILQSLETKTAEPILYTHSLWYSKAKTMLPYLFSTDLGIDNKQALQISTAIDILWTISVIVDDIYDKDQTRRSKPAAWTIYGAAETYNSAKIGYEAVLNNLSQNLESNVAFICKNCVDEGIESVKQHKDITLSCNIDDLIENYKKRDSFFASFPFLSLTELNSDHAEDLYTIMVALETYYLGGQIGNDLDDLFKGKGRQDLYSDVKSGLVTLPIWLMWQDMSDGDKKMFLGVFGKEYYLQSDLILLDRLKNSSNVFENSIKLIRIHYTKSIELLQPILRKEVINLFESLCSSQLDKFLKYKHDD